LRVWSGARPWTIGVRPGAAAECALWRPGACCRARQELFEQRLHAVSRSGSPAIPRVVPGVTDHAGQRCLLRACSLRPRAQGDADAACGGCRVGRDATLPRR